MSTKITEKTYKYYDMSKEKILIIFNHFKFPKYDRHGTHEDARRLTNTFCSFGFKVQQHDDLTYREINTEVSKVCQADNQNTSCVVIAILTHGQPNGEVWASNELYKLSILTDKIQKAPSLAGKPKLFIVQACRGYKTDDGQRVALDAGGGRAGFTIPTFSDFLILYSTIEDHYSFRDVTQHGDPDIDGSWLIKALCTVLDENHEDLDFVQMIALVSDAVSENTTYNRKTPEIHLKKTTPETRFTFRKFLKFEKQ